MRISDWSSDVCSSDLIEIAVVVPDRANHAGGVFQRIRRWRDGDIRGLPARRVPGRGGGRSAAQQCRCQCDVACLRSEEHTSELQSLMRISYAVFCLKKKSTAEDTNHHSTYTRHNHD